MQMSSIPIRELALQIHETGDSLSFRPFSISVNIALFTFRRSEKRILTAEFESALNTASCNIETIL